jgi:NAD(P)-dependent dehydrogenase (short-subunit alcohol dehydrogenase family)
VTGADALAGRAVLITGPARGIGAALARRLARRGARLALLGLEPERLAALSAELGGDHPWFECDVTDQGALDRAVEAAVAALGGLDAVVANAGVANNGTVAVNPADALARTIEVNLTGVVRTVSATVEHVTARRGYYLLVSSAAALRALPGMAAYAASKIGVEHFGSALRLELAHKGVAVGVAFPSWIDTDLVRDQQRDLRTFGDAMRRFPGPLGYTTSVERCAELLADAVARRRRQVFVPRSLAAFAWVRWVLSSAAADRIFARHARAAVPRLEREVSGLGRSFGGSSVALPPSPPARDG